MSAAWSVFRKEFRENLRDRRTLLSALVIGPLFAPILFGSLLALGFHHRRLDSDRPLSVIVSHPGRAPRLMAYLRQYDVRLRRAEVSRTAASALVADHRSEQVLFVPGDFGARLEAGEPAPLIIYADDSTAASSGKVARLTALLEQYSTQIARLRLVARGMDPLLAVPIAVQQIDLSTPASRSALALGVLSYFVLLTMLMGGVYLAIDATAGERERGSLEPLLTLPVRREHLVYGKILAACAYMTLSLALTVTAFAIVLRLIGLERYGMSVNLGPAVAAGIVLSCLPLVPFGAALMTLVAAFTRSYREAQTYVGLVILVPTLPLVFASTLGLEPSAPLMLVPSLGQHFLIMGLLRAQPLPAAYFAASAGASLAFGAALVFLVGRLYRREALLG
jgi:sodium transport system permease protein